MKIARTGVALLLQAVIVTGCSFGASKPVENVDPNAYPVNYRKQIATFLGTQLLDRDDFRGASIAEPAVKPVGDSQRYVVCLQFNGHNLRKDKVVIYFAGAVTQFVDAKPEQCADAAYQPFQELADVMPTR
jgi:hypothetical protein